MLSLTRVLVGISQGAIFPSIHNELGKWKDVVGPQYFSTVVSLITSGMYLGSAMAMLIMPQVRTTHRNSSKCRHFIYPCNIVFRLLVSSPISAIMPHLAHYGAEFASRTHTQFCPMGFRCQPGVDRR